MAKTRSQTGNITIKKEEEDSKDNLLLNGVIVTTRNKITKREPSKNNNRPLPVPQVKVEEDADTKSLLKSTSNHSKLAKGQRVSQEQINQLIDYVVNHDMNVAKAARKANIDYSTAHTYYNEYKNDPEKKVPLPRHQRVSSKRFLTQEQIENLIRYIVDDKMSIPKASTKANMCRESGRYYYKKYLQDPDHAIPVPPKHQYRKNEFIRHIINDKMSIAAASKKVKISCGTGRRCYHDYFKVQHPDIPTPSHVVSNRERYTQEQKEEVVGYIVNDKMSINAASRKANMNQQSARRHYHQYLKDNNMETPVSKSKYSNHYTQEKKDQLIHLIVNEKMTPTAAGKKLHMSSSSAKRYHYQYLKDNSLPLPAPKRITQDQIGKFIGYIVDDKMSVLAASKKVKMSSASGDRFYRQFLNNQKRDAPA